MLLTMFGPPLHIHLMIALTAKPSVHSPWSIGRENLFKLNNLIKQGPNEAQNIFSRATKSKSFLLFTEAPKTVSLEQQNIMHNDRSKF